MLTPNCDIFRIPGYGSYSWFSLCYVNEENKAKIKSIIDGSAKQVVVVAGFGGGSGSSGTIWLTEICKYQNSPVTVVCTIPFVFEGNRKQQRAFDAVKSFEENGIPVKALHAEELFKLHEDISLYNCFDYLDKYVSDTVTSLLLCCLSDNPVNLKADN